MHIVRENIKILKTAGFDVEEFGADTIVVRSVPEKIGNKDPETILLDILSELKNIGNPESIDEIQREIARIIACRSAVKAGDPLTETEMKHLVNSIVEDTSHYTCPHGRPISVFYPVKSIRKNFGR